jgi:magnesium transporter
MEAENTAPIEQIRQLLEEEDWEGAVSLLSSLHPADQAAVIADLDQEARAGLLDRLSEEALGDILLHMREEPRREVVADITPSVLAPVLDRVETDVAADILRELPEEEARGVLETMTTARDVLSLLPYADESAGGRMTPDLVALDKQWTADRSIGYLRRIKPEAEQVWYLYVVDADRRLEGVVSLRQLLVASPKTTVEEIMTPEVISVPAGTDQEECARIAQHYNLGALPVVDEQHRLVGVISGDDLLDVATEEATEDMYRMAGLTEEESLLRPLSASIAPRVGWLLINLATAFMAAITVSRFESTIAKVAVLAVFMPVIAGMGGNAGIQSNTLVVRSLALGEIDVSDVRRVLRREWTLGIINGIIFGILVGSAAFVWKDNVTLGIVVGVAMLGNMFVAATVGVLVPLGLRKVRSDPALASGIILTAMTDVLGFFFLLGLAALLVNRLT